MHFHYNTLQLPIKIFFLILIQHTEHLVTYHINYDQSFAMEPLDQIAIIGAKVTFPCRVLNKQGILQWTKDDFGLGIRRKLSGFERYTMVGSDEEGDFSLQIYPVLLDDDGDFQCQVSPGPNGQPAIRSRYAHLSVLVQPDSPKILQGSHIITTEDHIIELECISENGKPAAEITWIDPLGDVISDGIEYITERSRDQRRFTAKSILKLSIRKQYHNGSVVCQAQNTVDKTHRSASISLEVKYAPKVKISTDPSVEYQGKLPEFNNIKYYCDVDANPNDITYKWYIDNELINDAYTNELILTNLTRQLQHSVLKCESQNAVGKSSDSETLDISYKPIFLLKPQNVEADYDETILFHCEVDGNPFPELVWVFDPIDRINFQPRVVGTTNKLEIVASNETAGRYLCKANSNGYAEISSEAILFLKNPPIIISSKQQYPKFETITYSNDITNNKNDNNNNSEDYKYEIECIAISVPKANHISWTFMGKVIDLDAELDFSQMDVYMPQGVKSTLTIEDNYDDYYGTYTCVVVNSYGSDISEIIFSKYINYSTIIITSSITVIIVIFVAFLTYLIVYLKLRKRDLPPADIIPKTDTLTKSTNHLNKKLSRKPDEVTNMLSKDIEYPESNSASYSTTTTLSINKTDSLIGRGSIIHIPANTLRFSENYNIDGPTSIHSNQSINGSTSYVNYARDYYSPAIQHQQQQLQQHNCLMQKEITTLPTYV